jgi:NAD(P)-dependent dehydrogenase (short-subunit alcohol dehydrogenase family)
MANVKPVAVVSGANRGIGLEVAAELARGGMTVVAGSRDPARGEEAVRPLLAEGLDVRPRPLDVTDQASVEELAGYVETELGRLDVLVNNAGIYPAGNATDIDLVELERTWQTNTVGAWRLTKALVPMMRRTGGGRIVNVSSMSGSLAEMGSDHAGYSVSKAALNAVTRVLAQDLAGTGILVNSVCPGWVATDMGGPGAPRTVEQGAASVLWAALLPDDGPTGGFFRDGEPMPW